MEKLVPISERYLELQKDIAEGKREIEKLRLESDERRHRLEIEDRKSQRERDVERENKCLTCSSHSPKPRIITKKINIKP